MTQILPPLPEAATLSRNTPRCRNALPQYRHKGGWPTGALARRIRERQIARRIREVKADPELGLDFRDAGDLRHIGGVLESIMAEINRLAMEVES